MDALKQAIIRYADMHANADGLAVAPIAGVRVMCVRAPGGVMRSVYRPLVCMVLQGTKQMTVGPEAGEFSAGQSVIVAHDMPVTGRIVRASLDEPYIALAVELDVGAIRDLAAELEIAETPAGRGGTALFVDDTETAALDCGMRLMRLLDRPEAAPALRPAILKELHYWLLAGRNGAAIRRLALPDSHAQRIAAAVRILRAEFHERIPVQRLAAAARMSTSAFHRRFKAVTSLTPVQFQKQLRLIEARRLMLAEGYSASRAAFDVGYESISQFTREYGRMFGASPRRDTRSAGRGSVAAAGNGLAGRSPAGPG
ncbi:AraC family transcriptional regulator [Arenibaculum pallidiluteum]|uniref:AraC family transcriptional regulator n=1 Tax=Arenibaculum pallidiluteum TaxID=2812559 RepID=UPI001A961500|nr:AraC family transcriptional regulator [Arenibaculum pallidiluteum]